MGTRRKTAKRFDDGDEEEKTFESEIASPLASRTTQQGTPVATPSPRSRRTSTPSKESPSRPSSARSAATSGRKLRNSTPVEDSPKTSRRGPPICSSISAATETPPRTNTPRRRSPRLNKDSSTSTATLESASAYDQSRSSLEATSTPPSSTGNSSDNIEGLTAQLNGLTVLGEVNNDIEGLTAQLNGLTVLGEVNTDIEGLTAQLNVLGVRDEANNDLDSETKMETATKPPPADCPKMPKRTNSADSVVSFGSRDPIERKLMEYIPKSVNRFVAEHIMQVLQNPLLHERDEKGSVYVLRVTPYPPELSSEGGKGNKNIIIKVGNSKDVPSRLGSLRGGKCKFYRYEPLENYPIGIGNIELKYKAEALVHAHLMKRRYRPAKRCLCNSEHREFFEVKNENELKGVYNCITHWAKIVNEHHNTLWPGEVERLKLEAEERQRVREAAKRGSTSPC